MATKKLRIIPKPEEGTRSVFVTERTDKDFVYLTGNGTVDFICGNCGHILVKAFNENRIQNLVFCCNQCGKYNDTEQLPGYPFVI